VLAGIIGLAVAAVIRTSRSAGTPALAPPFEAGALVGGGPDGERVSVAPPAVIVYADDQCHYCAQELAHWAARLEDARNRLTPTVVLSPRSDAGGSHVPDALRRKLVHDVDGAIARRLGVRAVPFIAVIDSAGSVIAVHAGVTPASRLERLMSHPYSLPGDSTHVDHDT